MTGVRTAEVSNSETAAIGNCGSPPIAEFPRGRSKDRQIPSKISRTKFFAPNLCREEKSFHGLNSFTIAGPVGAVCGVSEEEFVEIEVMVDSGATETVMTLGCLDGVIDITDGAACKKGVHYEVANGDKIPNLGGR